MWLQWEPAQNKLLRFKIIMLARNEDELEVMVVMMMMKKENGNCKGGVLEIKLQHLNWSNYQI